MPETPSAPILEPYGSTSIMLAIGPDSNPPSTRYAVFIEPINLWAQGIDPPGADPVWLTREEWTFEPYVTGLAPSTTYTFKAKARDINLVTTDFGLGAEAATYSSSDTALDTIYEVIKASPTISAPSFLDGKTSVLYIAGKDLAEFGFLVDNIAGVEDIEGVAREEIIPGESAWRIWDEHFAPRRITAEGYIHGMSREDAAIRLGCLKSFLAPFFPGRSSAPAVLEHSSYPGKVWLTHLHSIKVLGALGKQSSSSSLKLALELTAPEPFAYSKDITRKAFIPSANGFYPLELGNAPSDAVYLIKGASVNPSFILGDMIFFTDFSSGLGFKGIENTEELGVFDPPGGEGAAFVSTEYGMGMSLSGAQKISFGATGNPDDGSFVVVFWPMFSSSDGVGVLTLFEHKSMAGGSVKVYWNPVEKKWVFNVEGEEVSTSPQSFLTRERIVLGVVWDTTNAGGIRIYVNGLREGSAPLASGLSSPPDLLELHTGTPVLPHVIYGLVAGWSRMLSSDEMRSIASDPMSVTNSNIVLSTDITLDAGDFLTLDSRSKTAVFFDVSANTSSNAISSVEGDIPVLAPGRKKSASVNTQTVVHTPMAAGAMEIKYRKRYL